MQLKLDRGERQGGIVFKHTVYTLKAALLVTPEEEAALKKHGFWKANIKPGRSDAHDNDVELTEYSFADLVRGIYLEGSLTKIEDCERGIAAGCKVAKRHMEGGQAGERIVDI